MLTLTCKDVMQRLNAIKNWKLILKAHVVIYGWIQPEMNSILLQFTIFPGNTPVLHIRRRGGLGIETVNSLKTGVRHHCLLLDPSRDVRMSCIFKQKPTASVGRSPPDPLPGLCPWTPLWHPFPRLPLKIFAPDFKTLSAPIYVHYDVSLSL